MLYQPEAFEALTDEAWNEERVQRRIREIVADTDEALRGPKLLWRAHEWDSWHATSPMKQLYVGAAGVLWGLDALRRREHAETTLDLADLAVRNLERFRERPDYVDWNLPEPRDSALFLGEAGIVLVAWRLAASTVLADHLYALVRANVDNPAEEVFWGAPGTLMAARAMLEWTGDERWQEASDETAEALLSRRRADGLWVQRLYGQEMTSLTPPHGLVGIVQALVPVLDRKRGRSLRRDTSAILERTAVVDNGAANWPPRPRPELPGPDGQIRLQWCAGAPGDRHRGRGVPGRRAPARGRGARVACRPARDGEGPVHLSRHGRQRLRVAEDVRTNRRRAMARPCAPFCGTRPRTGRAGA